MVILSPFFANMALNEMRLWRFSHQLDALVEILPRRAKIVATGSQVFVRGNNEACSFRAIKVFSIYTRPEERKEIERKIENFKFDTVKNSSFLDTPELYISGTFPLLIVMLVDGPYGAGLDVRCW